MEIENKLKSQLELYFGLDTSQIAPVYPLFRERRILRGEYFVEIGKYNPGLAFISEGVFRIFRYHEGREVTQWISVENDLITDIASLQFDTPARLNIQALTDCTLNHISSVDYRKLSSLVDGWNSIETRFLSSCFATLEDRVFSLLSMTAEERYDMLWNRNKEIFNLVPLRYLASMMGMTPETLSRIRKKRIS